MIIMNTFDPHDLFAPYLELITDEFLLDVTNCLSTASFCCIRFSTLFNSLYCFGLENVPPVDNTYASDITVCYLSSHAYSDYYDFASLHAALKISLPPFLIDLLASTLRLENDGK